MEMKPSLDAFKFLTGGGEMGALTRSKDWSNTPVGNPESWPQSLKTTLSILLSSKFPMFLWWGEELTCFYNDAYRPSLGQDGKHPSILGMPAEAAWKEIWHIIYPLIEQVLAGGEATWSEDQLIPIYRNGKLEDVYWTFSYSPVSDEEGKVAGVLVTCSETTDKIRTFNILEASNRRYRSHILQAPVAMCIFRGETFIVEIANEGMLEIWGKRSDDVLHKPIFEGLPEARGQGFEDLLTQVYTTGERFEANEHPVSLPRNGKIENTYLNFVYEALTEADGTISGIVAIASEVTEQVKAREALEEREQRVRALVNETPFPMAVYVGPEMRIELANQSIIDIWGKGNDVIGKLFNEVVPELGNQQVFRQIKQVFESGTSYHTQNTPLDLVVDGKLQTYYFNYSFTALYDSHGEVYGVMNTGAEVTALNVAKKKIEESDQRFRNTVRQAPVGITILRGPDFIVEMANDTYLQVVDRKEPELVRRPLFESLPEVEEVVRPLLENVMSTGIPFHGIEYPIPVYRYGKEELSYFDFLYHPLKEDDGTISGIMVTVTDVSESVKSRQFIVESEQKFRLLADSMPQHIWTSDPEGNLNYYNQSVYDYSGLTPGQVAEGGWLQIVHPDDREENTRYWTEAVATGNDFLFEHRFRKHNGEYRWQLSRAIPQKDAAGKIQMWVGTSTDIQDQKTFVNELEKQVQERTAELEEKNSELEKMNKELQSFAYISSHDLQEPLRKIQTFSSRIVEKEHDQLSEQGRDYFRRMQVAAQRMQTLIEDLLAYSRTSTAERKLEKTDLVELVDEVRSDLEEELQQHHAVIEATNLGEADIIPFQFRQLLYNLISNAIKFTPETRAPHIRISARIAPGAELGEEQLAPEQRYCHISVADNGIGFAPEYSEKIFEVFQRLHGKDQYTGTGIGLAIVKKIVENHNGIITAKGEPGAGATFDMYIPAWAGAQS